MKTEELMSQVYLDSQKPQTAPLLPTGLKDLDELTWGLHKGQVCLVAGFPKTGKTTLALNFAANLANGLNANNIHIFSFEMSVKRLAGRFLAMFAKVDNSRIIRHNLDVSDRQKIESVIATINGIPITLHFGEVDTPGGLLNFFSKNSPDVVIVDYVQKVKQLGGSKLEAIDNWVNIFCEQCVKLNFAGIVCSQMTQTIGFGDHKKIGGETGKGSRILEEAPDTILKLNWHDGSFGCPRCDSDYDKGGNCRRCQTKLVENLYTVKVDYNRDGDVGLIPLVFVPKWYKFFDFFNS